MSHLCGIMGFAHSWNGSHLFQLWANPEFQLYSYLAPGVTNVGIEPHWKIENRLHWRRDVTLGEDACQTRTGAVPSLLAQLNSTVLSLMDRLGVRNVARQARYFDANPEQAVQLLLSGSCSVY